MEEDSQANIPRWDKVFPYAASGSMISRSTGLEGSRQAKGGECLSSYVIVVIIVLW
jgi:hypothetical protein